ncbi:MAG: MFS transporter [Actinomycetia bacterium]|nr:MFS transporter [Actinomycetes bacterium]
MNPSLRSLHRWRMLRGSYLWMPISFLYLSRRLDIGTVLDLEALYYLSVVVLEVPSGWVSDRAGRVRTLRASSLLLAGALALFLMGDNNVGLFALAQITLAASFAASSGTDIAFHADHLESEGTLAELGDREARFGRDGSLARVVGSLTGGALALIDLRVAYTAALALAVLEFVALWPARESSQELSTQAFLPQVSESLRHLRDPILGWTFAYVVVQLTTEHLPAQFSQPYLAEVLGADTADLAATPLVSGIMVACLALVAAWGSARSIVFARRWGTVTVLLGVGAVEIVLLLAMAAVVHPLILVLLLGRALQPSMGNVLVAHIVAPRIDARLRATHLSVASLAGRGGFGIVLLGLGRVADGSLGEPGALRAPLIVATIIGAVGLAALAVTRGAVSAIDVET